MNGVTFEMVLTADVDGLRRSAAAWDRLGRLLDDRADELVVSLRRLPEVWETGAASAAALTHCTGLRQELDSTFAPVLTIGQALAQLANGLAELRPHAERLVQEGSAAHVTVRSDGSMQLDPAHSNEWTARALSSLVWKREEILQRAAELDARAAKVIGQNTAVAAGAPAARVERTVVPAQGTDPAAVRRWWDSLSFAQRRFVVGEFPDLVGGLDGVPVSTRDVANRIVLDRDHDALTIRRAELDAREAYLTVMVQQGRVGELYPNTPYAGRVLQAELDQIRAERGEVDGKLKGIDRISNRLADPDKPRAYLIGFSSADDGRAVVSVGNPDAADNVLTYVPGTGTDLSKIGGDIVRADRMAEDAILADPTKETASMVWLGYDAPDGIPNAGMDQYADDGGKDLGRFQSGLRATHDGQPSHNVVMGHSYGSTVIGHGVTGGGVDANAYVFVGSPGVGVNAVSELGGVQPAQVWATGRNTT